MRLSFEHISKLYGDTAALQQIDLTLGSGVYGLLGSNGAGKTCSYDEYHQWWCSL